MKRNKNDAVTVKEKTAQKNEPLNGGAIPSEKINADGSDERELPFKKVLYGFNPDEVHSFISELTSSYEASLKLHESKLSTMKEELVFSNRERDRYIKKCKEYQSQSVEKAPFVEDKSDEYNAIIAKLEETVKTLEAENEILRNIANSSESTQEYSEKISELENRNEKTEAALVLAEKTNAELSAQIEKYASISDEYKAVMQGFEETRSRLALCEKELKTKCDEVAEKDEKIKAFIAEKNGSEKRIAELEVKNNVLSQRVTECEEDVSKLREANKSIIFENAEKINMLENEYTKSKLAAEKELKLYGYYVDRAELTVAELTKQIAQIKQSISNSEI